MNRRTLVKIHDGNLPASSALTDTQVAVLKADLMALLREQARRYTLHASTSLPQETLEELMASLCYTLGINPSGDPALLKPFVGKDLFSLYSEGKKRLEQRIRQARRTIRQLCQCVPDMGSAALRHTLSSLLFLLDRYDTRFFAHRILGEIVYPLISPVPETLLGVDYALAYMDGLATEIRLTSCFAQHRCLSLLDGMSSRWRDLPLNITRPAAENALALTVLQDNPRRLYLTDEQRRSLVLLMQRMTQGQVLRLFTQAADTLSACLAPEDPSLHSLLHAAAKDLAPRARTAAVSGTLSHVFFSFGVPAGPTSCSMD